MSELCFRSLGTLIEKLVCSSIITEMEDFDQMLPNLHTASTYLDPEALAGVSIMNRNPNALSTRRETNYKRHPTLNLNKERHQLL